MQAENFKFGGGLTETTLHPAVLVAMVLSVVLILLLPRKYAVVPFLMATFLVPRGQQLVAGGVHLFVYRILILSGCIRMLWCKLVRGESLFGQRWNSVDNVFIAWALLRATAFVLLYREVGAATNQFGFLLDALGGFFLLRFLIRNTDDVRRTVRVFAVVAIILGVCMLNEKLRNQNVFGILGGVPLIPLVRNGSIRAQGPFAQPLLAGTFGATLLPLFVWLWMGGKSKALAVLGSASSLIVAVCSSSSTAPMAYAAAIAAVCFWPLRKKMRLVRWGVVILLVALHLVMKAPVWFLIAHVDLTGGSSGSDRAYLIDNCIRHFTQWWLVGTNQNAKWGWDMWDLCDQYVAEAVTGGLATLVCFLLLISRSFGRIGRARKAVEGRRKLEWLMWILGATLFAHVMGFFGISYFDQTQFSWWALLAMISAVTAQYIPKTVRKAAPIARRSMRSQVDEPSFSSAAISLESV